MKTIWIITFLLFSLEAANCGISTIEVTDSLNEITVTYRTRKNFIIIPVMINDSIKVNLLLDPRCKSVILFGKRHRKLLGLKRNLYFRSKQKENYVPQFLNNKLSVGPAVGENIPIVVVPNNNPLNFFISVNGIMGYDLLSNCEITFNKKAQKMTIRVIAEKNLTMSASR